MSKRQQLDRRKLAQLVRKCSGIFSAEQLERLFEAVGEQVFRPELIGRYKNGALTRSADPASPFLPDLRDLELVEGCVGERIVQGLEQLLDSLKRRRAMDAAGAARKTEHQLTSDERKQILKELRQSDGAVKQLLRLLHPKRASPLFRNALSKGAAADYHLSGQAAKQPILKLKLAGPPISVPIAGGWRERKASEIEITAGVPLIRQAFQMLWELERWVKVAKELLATNSGPKPGAERHYLVVELLDIWVRCLKVKPNSSSCCAFVAAGLHALGVEVNQDAVKRQLFRMSEYERMRAVRPTKLDLIL